MTRTIPLNLSLQHFLHWPAIVDDAYGYRDVFNVSMDDWRCNPEGIQDGQRLYFDLCLPCGIDP